ncbi:hypothetical protein QFC22_006287 [Naganishia vaughanmartiniae]|uniref:Uncharacterized protein n=1 Tax=Naganishia vaughanmartiniae TaxID=1424756 RepID=A0ACC2WMY5_9TREE|nr:hypothetical protein QFC22_006287 [Naganishia vaughanmartiniae]
MADTAEAAFKRTAAAAMGNGNADALSPPMTPDAEQASVFDLKHPIIAPITPTDTPSDVNIPDNYVTKTLNAQKRLPPLTWRNLAANIEWISLLALTLTPVLTIYGICTTSWNTKTFWWSVIYYYITGLGITAGYHRLWAHRSYNAHPILQYILACAGAGAVQGSIKWWSRGHRAHHRYTDTDLDPYSAHHGFWWAHVGWMLVKPRTKIGVADVSDLTRNKVVRWQHENYLSLLAVMGFIFPTLVAGLGWGDWRGGFFFAGAARLLFVHHSTFCVNSLAHWLGETPFDNKHSPRDHIITALVTIGEGYHNFHHQFPMDYRNAYWSLGYDPTKWLIKASSLLGLATHLKTFPENEIRKGVYTMQLTKLAEQSGTIQWPIDSNLLPVISWDDFVEESKTRELMVIHGFIHDVSTFMNDHPGGAHLLKRAIGTDASVAFFGGVYDHSNAAHNQLAMMRVGILDGGMEVEHLKRPRASSTASASSASSITSAASSASSLGRLSSFDALDQLASSEVSHGTSYVPEHQPTALMADKYTLHLPPSERLRIARTAPLPRSEFTVKKQQ